MPASHQITEAYFESGIGFPRGCDHTQDIKQTMVKSFDSNPPRPEECFCQVARALIGIHSPLDHGSTLPCVEWEWFDVFHFLCMVSAVIAANLVGLPG